MLNNQTELNSIKKILSYIWSLGDININKKDKNRNELIQIKTYIYYESLPLKQQIRPNHSLVPPG